MDLLFYIKLLSFVLIRNVLSTGLTARTVRPVRSRFKILIEATLLLGKMEHRENENHIFYEGEMS